MWQRNDDDPKTLELELPAMTGTKLAYARTELQRWILENISVWLANR
jgi:hypothetical protein